ncbi:hypothetical protein IQ215_13765 [Cyanobacterium stanieri LEGE 03274]|uniref:Uncharacterized protein n=1 Tax=Cyanobacterium stanieri LEGE 03274 TaxID=1828756 RepID=A0ABR9V781_9CHRO|nr:hypothetical protein [Cyanobacterium stanieri]MBE9223765.1 hypothetical protein [Cyanobacterium stanieri LEGE 03274]
MYISSIKVLDLIRLSKYTLVQFIEQITVSFVIHYTVGQLRKYSSGGDDIFSAWDFV